ncbi:endo-1,4-beta-xylanase [Paenibacillus amylolyticus]|nr:endo-1,4-beta-xylanase [Paenibacillus amylolyticus]
MPTKIPSLHAAYANTFKIGAAVHTRMLQSEGEFIAKHFNSITAENQMKFEEIHPEEDRYTFEAADQIVDFAVAQGIAVRWTYFGLA